MNQNCTNKCTAPTGKPTVLWNWLMNSLWISLITKRWKRPLNCYPWSVGRVCCRDQCDWCEGEHRMMPIFPVAFCLTHSQRRFSVRFSDSGLQGFALASCDGALICSSLEDFIKITSNSRRKVAPSTVLMCWDCHGFCTSVMQRGRGICRVACSLGGSEINITA